MNVVVQPAFQVRALYEVAGGNVMALVGSVVSRMIESVELVEMLPAASLYWTQTVFVPSAPVRVNVRFAPYGLIAENGATNVALEQSAAWATR